MEDRVGEKALHWYLETQAYDKNNILLNREFFQLVTHCLVAERRESSIWNLLYAKHVPALLSSTRPHYYCKGPVLRSLVAARVYWSSDLPAFANGIAPYLQAIAGSKSRAMRSETYINVSVAGLYLLRFAFTGRKKCLDPHYFDRLLETLPVWQVPGIAERDVAESYLKLTHPKIPDPRAAVEWLDIFDREVKSSKALQEIFTRTDTKGAYNLYVYILKLAQALNRDEHKQQAYRALDLGEKHTFRNCLRVHLINIDRSRRCSRRDDAVLPMLKFDETSR